MTSFESSSTWRQPVPEPASRVRRGLIDELGATIAARSPHRLRVAIDGFTAAGKTSFGHELAASLRSLGRPTLRASMDDFKHPWRDSRERRYDRVSGEGYYRNAYDFASATTLLLDPAGPGGSGSVALCAHDPLTGEDHRSRVVQAPDDAVLVVDTVFAFRPEWNPYWDYRIWIDVDAALSLRRGVRRDQEAEGSADAAERLHRDRYHAALAVYRAEVDPRRLADVIIDNSDFANPRLVYRSGEPQAVVCDS